MLVQIFDLFESFSFAELYQNSFDGLYGMAKPHCDSYDSRRWFQVFAERYTFVLI